MTQRQVAEALGLSVPLISAWESSNSPVLPTEERLAAYARLFASPRSFEGQRPTLLDDLDRGEELRRRELLDELVRLRESASEERRRAAVVNERTTFWSFQDEQPITVLCSRLDDHQLGGDDQRLPDYASPWHPNYIASLRNGDADTVLELLPHIQARNPASTVRVLTPGQTGFDDLTGHLVLLGEIGAASESAGAMPYLVRRLALPLGVYLPAEGDTEFDREFVVFVDDDGEPSEDGRGRERHGPRYLMGEGGSGGRRVLVEGYPALEYDVALLARSANPFNLATTVTIASGIFSRGTFGAVRSLTDPNLATTNEQWLRANVDPDDFWMLMHVPVFSGPNGAQTLTPDLTRPFHRLRVWSRRK